MHKEREKRTRTTAVIITCLKIEEEMFCTLKKNDLTFSITEEKEKL